MTMPITDKGQITYLLNTCDEKITRKIIGEDDPWTSETTCGVADSQSKCYEL